MPTGKISKPRPSSPIPLLLCPFDGGKAELEHFMSRKFPWKVQCIRCWVSTPGFSLPELAVDCWNRRV